MPLDEEPPHSVSAVEVEIGYGGITTGRERVSTSRDGDSIESGRISGRFCLSPRKPKRGMSVSVIGKELDIQRLKTGKAPSDQLFRLLFLLCFFMVKSSGGHCSSASKKVIMSCKNFLKLLIQFNCWRNYPFISTEDQCITNLRNKLTI